MTSTPSAPAREHRRGSVVGRMVVYAPGTVVPAALTLVTSMVMTRIFSPVAFGRYSLALVVAVPARLVFTTWLTQGMGKFLPPVDTAEGRRTSREAAFLSAAVVFLAEALLGAAILLVGVVLLGAEQRTFLLPVVAFVVVTSLFEVLSYVFPLEARAKEYTTYRLVDSVVTLALRLFLVSGLVGMDVTLMFWSVVLSNGVLLPFMWVRAGFPAPHRLAAVAHSVPVRRLALSFLAFGLPMTLWFFSGVLLDVGDRFVLNFLSGPGPVGVYDASYRLIAGLATLMAVPVTITLHPYLMSLAGEQNLARVGELIGAVVENLLLGGLLCAGLTFVLHDEIARLLLGAEFRGGSVVMAPVLLGAFLFNIGAYAHKPFEIVGRTRPMVVLGFVAAAANLGLCFVLIPVLGLVGAAYATLLAYLLYAVAVGALGRRIVPWRIDVRRTASLGALVVGGVVAVGVLRELTRGLTAVVSLPLTTGAGAGLAGLLVALLLRRPVAAPGPGDRK